MRQDVGIRGCDVTGDRHSSCPFSVKSSQRASPLRPQPRQTPSTRVEAMAPIIKVDTATSPSYIDAHHSTQCLTTCLHNDQLILVEVQGTFEYNITNREEPVHVRLGDITWDETVYSTLLHVLTLGFTGISAYWTSQNVWTPSRPHKSARRPARQTDSQNKVLRRQGMAIAYCHQEKTSI